ncbi:MAG TPA: hypothetical protein VGD43_14370 [Micromonospora sp.]
MSELEGYPETGRVFGQEAAVYRGLPMMVAPAPVDTEIVVWWPQPDEMPELTRSYMDAAATRLLHAVYLAESAGDPR